MLILTRKPGESLFIGDSVKITVMEIKGNQIRLGIDAPRQLRIAREEIYMQIIEENKMASDISAAGSLGPFLSGTGLSAPGLSGSGLSGPAEQGGATLSGNNMPIDANSQQPLVIKSVAKLNSVKGKFSGNDRAAQAAIDSQKGLTKSPEVIRKKKKPSEEA